MASPAPLPSPRPAPLTEPEQVAVDDAAVRATFTATETQADGRLAAVSHLRLAGLYCVACATTVEAALLAEPGVGAATVSYAGRRATVRWDPERTSPSRLIACVARAGYGATPDMAEPMRTMRQSEQRRSLWRVFVAAFCAMQVMMYVIPLYVAGPGTIDADLRRLLEWAAWLLSIPVLAFAAGPFFGEAWRGLRRAEIRMELPVAIGIGTAFVASSGAVFDPGGIFGSAAYFDSLTMLVCFLLVARILAQRAHDRVAAALEDAIDRLPAAVRRVGADGRTTLVALPALAVGDRVRVHAGEAFPADGPLVDGSTSADEALLSGESAPVAKAVGDLALAGSLNLDAPVTQRVDRIGADTRHEGIVALLRDVAAQRPRLLQSADRLAGPFLGAVLVLALASGVAWAWLDPGRAVSVAVAVLIVTCPCALSLAAPSALLAAAGALARRGILTSRIDAIEALAAVDTVCFDKTGTLTDDRLRLERTVAMPCGRAPAESAALLRQAASLAASSNHPAARALADADPAARDDPAAAWRQIREVPGCGIEATDRAGARHRLGAAAWAVEGAALPAAAASAASRTWLACEGRPLACFELGESMRADAAPTVALLRDAGLDIELLSGDGAARVSEVADRLGIGRARGALLPEMKLAAIAAMQGAGRRVAMVGDGLNDAPVMARADVSFAMAGGSAVTRARADFILLSGRLGDIAVARGVARRAVRVVRQSLGWALAYNAVCVPLAVLGAFPPWAAGLGMGASSLLVVLNALRIDRRPLHRRDAGAEGAAPPGPAAAIAAVATVNAGAEQLGARCRPAVETR